jgi:hypothetical protein
MFSSILYVSRLKEVNKKELLKTVMMAWYRETEQYTSSIYSDKF